jgi:hypothetical protein
VILSATSEFGITASRAKHSLAFIKLEGAPENQDDEEKNPQITQMDIAGCDLLKSA